MVQYVQHLVRVIQKVRGWGAAGATSLCPVSPLGPSQLTPAQGQVWMSLVCLPWRHFWGLWL